ncbi:MAG: DUF362 domain-containing protein [Planctomycetota bacterium]
MNESKKRNPSSVDRREFCKRVAIDTALGAGALAAGFGFKSRGLPVSQDMPPEVASSEGKSGPAEMNPVSSGPRPLAVAKGDDPSAATEQVIRSLGGISELVSRNDRVLIKPNIGWDRRVKFAANTNPDVVATLARLCLEAGAKKVVVTDSPCNNPARCFDKSGLKEALAGMDVELLIPTARDYVDQDLGGEVLKTWPVLKALLESDKVINVPIAKHHSSAVLSLGMKNWYGILGGGKQRGQLHQEMALSIAELAEYVRPALTVLDAYRILFRNGPQGGSLQDTKMLNTIAASRDPVAVDAFGTGFFGLKPEEVPYIPIAVEKGLGIADLDSIEIITTGV